MGAIAGYDIPPEDYWDGPVYEECGHCHGTGHILYDRDTDLEVTEDEWRMLPEESRGKEICCQCDGKGQVEVVTDYEALCEPETY